MADPNLRLLVVGVTHKTAPVEIRERLALSDEARDRLVARLRETGTREFLVLNTCNRVEIYAATSGNGDATAIASHLAAVHGISEADLGSAVLSQCDSEAVQHLFEVASGIDSQMVGETEILGQVKDAYEHATKAGTVGGALNRIFQKAFHSAKVVRSQTAIGEGQVSVATVAVSLAGQIFGDLGRSKVLVVGAGDIAEKTVKALKSRRAGSVTISNRTLERAEALASELGATALPFERMIPSLTEFDVVVCSSSSPGYLISLPALYDAMRRRPTRPMFLIDLALPRDIDPGVGELPNVFLYNLDDLAKIVEENIASRRSEIDRSRAIIAERASAVWRKVAGERTG
jgi:glutamyl-tRNA reductase